METSSIDHEVVRPAEDIVADIAALIRRYPPLVQSRHWFTYSVKEGVVSLQGNIKALVAKQLLLDNVRQIPGVVAVEADALHSDEELRHQVGKLIPPGVLVHVDFGRVVISGQIANDSQPDVMLDKIAALDGVRRVENELW